VAEITTRARQEASNLPGAGVFEDSGQDHSGITDFTGSINDFLPVGVYRVTVSPIEGIKFYYSQTFTVGVGPNDLLIGVAKNSLSSVFGIDDVYAQTEENRAQNALELPQGQKKVTVQLFEDNNRNGELDSGEAIVPWAGVKVELVADSNSVTYELFEGWNFISFPFKPKSIVSAKDLINDITATGGYVTTISVWDGNAWDEYSQRGETEYGHDFALEAGRAYFILSHQNSTWTVAGEPLDENFKLTLYPGWNGVGIPRGSYTAENVLDQVISLGKDTKTNVTDEYVGGEMAKWNFGIWDVLVKRIFAAGDEVYGFDYPISNQEGYFIFSNKNLVWKP
jgi:hypothetical protein